MAVATPLESAEPVARSNQGLVVRLVANWTV